MVHRAVVTLALVLALSACSDAGGGSTGNLTSGTGTSGTTDEATTTTGGTTSTTTDAPTSEPATTGEPDPTTSTTTTSTTGVIECDGGGLGPGDHTLMLDHDGAARTALVHIPPGYDQLAPVPVVLNFHGFTQDSDGQLALSAMNPVADAHDFVVVYPQGLDYSWNAGECCGLSVVNEVDDIGFVRALVARLQDELCVDPRRVYATGMSNGGYLSHRLACEATDLIAAIAPVSATIVIDPCEPARPIPVMMFNGTTDILVPYGGGLYQSAPQSFADWAGHNHCNGAPAVTQQAGGATCEAYDDCDDDVTVTLCTLEGMGHCWPGNPECPFGTPSVDLDASALIWEFFSGYALP
ncbi:alpha/beta hydrolase family esterase [Nannocystis bainbridge]|uniref:PHB depolymerase family esterase n=1 Tax=Nannocystis bainbridge TaxID=2995303 RepID=A0ABT5DXV8_9BACT|nr:PHB depolymerase family esterase [Nannocystis bainbridge]MDC0717573.1 PHB depolymerase family esterase [Nannocystis bainbridge]